MLRTLLTCFLAATMPALAMIEHGPLAREAAERAGCQDAVVERLGQEGSRLIYTMQCGAGSPLLEGRIVCNVDSCEVEQPAGDTSASDGK